MLHQVIELSENAKLYTYISDISMTLAPRDALLVIPGGGYGFVSMDREGEPVALEFCGRGYNCFVLEYSVGEKAKFPAPLREAALAMAHIRENAQSYRIDPERIFAMGFSAGGHLTASLGSFWHREEITGVAAQLAKPRGTVLIYPVITTGEFTHQGTTDRLCGRENPEPSVRESWSLEKQVSEHTAPAFLAHTAADLLVPVENTLLFAAALSRHKIPMEVHIFPRGAHGLALANFITARTENGIVPEFAQWTTLADAWMKRT